ncbi:hypothetical protein H4219_003600 [Mycoemilia scoparia]|uniref:UBX domain-containing protein n=1 Tax=Mycoemilia scoparia TaxID=417184 RepID=A0A9W8DML0_9FUNG|nr:hypothetical protein H4219_003600 [Mycoemilia scoparia]
MAASDKDTLIQMGFTADRVEKAIKETKGSGLQPALDCLGTYSQVKITSYYSLTLRLCSHPDDGSEEKDQPVEQTTAEATPKDEKPETTETEIAQSLKCDECGKSLRTEQGAQNHAIKTGHSKFSQSTEEIKPLTEEEKQAKLKELQEKAELRRKMREEEEKKREKEEEIMRRTKGKDLARAREEYERSEAMRLAKLQRQQRQEDNIAKQQILKQLELDKLERQRKREEEKKAVASGAGGVAAGLGSILNKQAAKPSSAGSSGKAQIQVRIAGKSPLNNTFESSNKISDVRNWIAEKTQLLYGEFDLYTPFPRQKLDDDSKTLGELGLAPRAALVLEK